MPHEGSRNIFNWAEWTTIRTKLTLASVCALFIVIGVSFFGAYQLRQVNVITQQLSNISVKKIEHLATIKRALITHNSLAKRQLQTNDYRMLSTFGTSMKSFEREMAGGLALYSRTSLNITEKTRLEEFRNIWTDYVATQETVYRKHLEGDKAAARTAFDNTVSSLFERALSTVSLLENMSSAQTDSFRKAVEETYNTAQLLTVALAAAAVATALLVIWWTARHISTPLLLISETMRKLTAGDDSAEVPDVGNRRDEIGILIDAAQAYRESVIHSKELADEAEVERQRLLAAISNMPLGFCMFDSEMRLMICNDHYAELYDMPDELRRPGTPYIDLVRDRVSKNMYFGDDKDEYIRISMEIAANKEKGGSTLNLRDGRTISVLKQPLSEGWLTMHEDVTERRAAEERIHHMARHDALTDLPNRNLFSERINEVLNSSSRNQETAILCLDLDRFKSINDTLGHPVGDELLKQTADRLLKCVRSGDTVARLGGDEFAIIQRRGEQPKSAIALSKRIIESINKPFEIDGQSLSIGTSIGIAITSENIETADTLLKNADMALYRAKGEGRGDYRIFEPEMDKAIQEKRRLEVDLRRALSNNLFSLEYQPQVDVDQGKVIGVEALLRWRDPIRGNVSPADFVPIAEEIGLMIPIGEWVLRQACKDAAGWRSDLGVSVNLSPVQFRDGRLASIIESALADADLSPQRLELEITEGVLLSEDDCILRTLHDIQETGVRFSMDDFGTGYSSLGYLKKFPFDKIKIDASFVSTLAKENSSLAIVRAVIGLGTSLGITTIAEGVETPEQLDLVSKEGCSIVQGYLFSKAVPPEQVPSVINQIETKKFRAA